MEKILIWYKRRNNFFQLISYNINRFLFSCIMHLFSYVWAFSCNKTSRARLNNRTEAIFSCSLMLERTAISNNHNINIPSYSCSTRSSITQKHNASSRVCCFIAQTCLNVSMEIFIQYLFIVYITYLISEGYNHKDNE